MFTTASSRMFWRRIGVAHTVSVIGLALTLLLFYDINPNPSLGAYLFLTLEVLSVLIVLIDIGIIEYCVRKARQAVPDVTFREAYFFGASWREMFELASLSAQAVKLFEEERVQRAEKKAEIAARKEQRLSRRDARKNEKYQYFMRRAFELDIPKAEMEEAIVKGAGDAQQLVADHEHRLELLLKGRRLSAEEIIRKALAESVEEAEVALAKIEALVKRADKLSIGVTTRQALSRGGFVFAEWLVSDTEKRVKHQDAISSLRLRIGAVSEEHRQGLLAQLAELEALDPDETGYAGTFRRKEYNLERAIDGARSNL